MTMHLRLLLIEDSEDDAALVVRALTLCGYAVTAERVETRETLAAALDRQAWDLVIADYTMPRFSGTAALELLRERDPDMPFIFVSGTIGEDAAVAAMKTGAHDYIMKGNLKRLIPAIDRELRDARVRRERKGAEQRLAHLAYHDALTDLPNRTLLYDRLQQAVLGAHRSGEPLTLLVMDLDRFKEINDTMGHPAGDRVLQLVASRLRGTLREADTVARLGGDEFALVLPSTDIDGAVLDRAQGAPGARAAIHHRRPFAEGPGEHRHCALSPSTGRAPRRCCRRPTSRCISRRPKPWSGRLFAGARSPHAPAAGVGRRSRQAIDRHEFFLEYQPILHLQTGFVVGVEALVRWNHPRLGRLLPGEFIHLAEQTGLIHPLTTLVLDTALEEWPSRSADALHHRREPVDPQPGGSDTARSHRGAAAGAGRGAPSLTLEITENVIMSDPVRSKALTRLHDMGVRIAIDDFGTGYSSLSYLRQLPSTS